MRATSKALVPVVLVISFTFLLKASVPQVTPGTWQTAGHMGSVREGAASVLLSDGRVLITGGSDANGPQASAEMFDTTGAFVSAQAMHTARSGHAALVLQDGRVLVTGGNAGSAATNSAEIYDPVADSWVLLGSVMTDARSGHTASLLPDGRVLLAGGQNSGGVLNTLEIFDPSNESFSSAGTLSSPRLKHGAATLQDGRVLLVGGYDGANALASTDIFDPTSNAVVAGPILSVPRRAASATILLDGKVLVSGGNDGSNDLASAEICDPATSAFSVAAATLATPRSGHQVFLLPDNNSVLILGGTSAGTDLASAEIYIPWTGAFQSTAAMSTARPGLTGSPLSQNGLLLVAGGTNLSSSELYGFATVRTDKSDYAPGDVVTITGSGWRPGETVTLSLVESPLLDTHPPMTAVADVNGNIFNNQFSPDIHDLNIRFYLTATGSQSQAQNTFTDSNIGIVTVGAQSPSPVVAGSSASFPVTVNFTGNSNPCSVTFTTNGLPTGASGSAPGVTGASNNTPKNTTLTISTTSGVAAGPYTFTLTAVAGSGCNGGNSTSNSATLAVQNTTNLSVNSITGVFGQTVSLSATLTSGSPAVGESGQVINFTLNGNAAGSATTNSSGVATLSTSLGTIPPGSYPTGVGASFATNGPILGSTASASLTVSKADTTTTITSDQPDPSTIAQPVTVKYTVSAAAPGSGTPTGNVQVSDGTDTCVGTVAAGQCDITLTTVGARTLTATYQGDSNFNASPASAGVAHTVVTPANLSYTANVAFDSSANPADTIVRSGQLVTVKLTVTNSGQAGASGVTPPSMSFSATGTASTTPCGSGSPHSGNVSGTGSPGSSLTYTYSCGPVSGNGTLTFTTSGQATGNDAISGSTVSTSGSSTSNPVTVDSSAPIMGLSPANGTYNAPFSFTWNITDPAAGGVSSGVDSSTCLVKVDGSTVSTACSGSNPITTGGAHTVVVSASDIAGNAGSDTRSYTVIVDNQPPVVTLTFAAPDGDNGWFIHSPVVSATLSANDSTTGNSNVTAINCTDGVNPLTATPISGLGTPIFSASISVSGEGTHNISCTATDSAGNTGASTGSTAMPVIVNIDVTAPTFSATRLTAANGNGWNKTDVTVRFACTDSTSGVASIAATGAATGTSTTSPLDVTVTTEGVGQSVDGTCKDAAGLSATAGVSSINIDKTKPVITGNRTPAANGNGWNNTDVTVGFTCAETGLVQSGIATDTVAGATVSTEGTNQSVTNTGSCVDKAGNIADAQTVPGISIDKTKPSASAAASPGPNAYGWNNTDVTVTFSGNDSLSGIDACDSSVILSSEGANQSASGTCKDKAGNVSDPASVTGINIDKTKPVITGSRSPLANSYGWNNTDVTVSFSCADALSGIANDTVAGATLSGEGAGQSVTNSGLCTDKAGNTADPATVTGINIDKTNPTITVAISPAGPAPTGWYNISTGGKPTVTFTCVDSLSGVADCTPAVLVGEGANQTISGTAVDKAGNTASASIMHINVDVTAPTINLVTPNGGSYLLNQPVNANYSCSDTGSSGVATCNGTVPNGSAINTASVGSKTFTVNATDVAGNAAATVASNYSVLYASGGLCLGDAGHQILQPINFDGSSVFKQKSTVPAKFRVCDFNGSSIGTAGVVSSFRLVQILAGTVLSTVDEAVDSTTPDNAFRWDPTAQQWIFNMNTKSLNANYTYYYVISLNDGSAISFYFGLK